MFNLEELKYITGIDEQGYQKFVTDALARFDDADNETKLLVRIAANQLIMSGCPIQYGRMFINNEVDLYPKEVILIDALDQAPRGRRRMDFFNDACDGDEMYGRIFNNDLNTLFIGTNGNGKTWTSISMLVAAIKRGLDPHYITSNMLYKLHNDASYNDQNESLFAKLKQSKYLVIDELGKEPRTQSFVHFIELFLRDRLTAGLPTTVCSNLNGVGRTSIHEFYGDSVKSVIDGHYHIFVFTSTNDYRRSSKKGFFSYE